MQARSWPGALNALVMRRSGVQIPEAAPMSSPGTSLTPVPGSWKDPETVRRFYSGITDQTLAQAMAIHGWGGTDA